MKLSELKIYLSELTTKEEVEAAIADENRAGALKLAATRLKQLDQLALERQAYDISSEYEKKYEDEIICGIDEVGRGPLAGPVVACAVILEDNHYYAGLTDSKKLSKKRRQVLEADLISRIADYNIGIATVEEIDQYNIYEATKIAMKRAVSGLRIKPSVLLIDAMQLNTGLIEESIIKGDQKSVSISAASIIAKEYRDRLMESFDEQYPGYDFNHNAGYGTQKHLDGIKKHGITPIHRKTFEPIKSLLAEST